MRAPLLLALVAAVLLAGAAPSVAAAQTATASAAVTRTSTLAALTSSTTFTATIARTGGTMTATSVAARRWKPPPDSGRWAFAVGPRAQRALARPFDLPTDDGVDLLIDFGGWSIAPPNANIGLFLRLGVFDGPHFTAPSGETWRRSSALGLGMYVHAALTNDLVDSDAVYFAPVAGGRFEISGSFGEWNSVPCATRLRDAACQRSVFAAETTRFAFAPHGTIGLVAAWWRLKITLLATLGVELGTGTIRYNGLTTAAARAAFYEVAAPQQPSGVSLVGGLELMVGIGSQLVQEER